MNGDVTSGGPSERVDLSMAKSLANFDFKSIAFNQNPPHFTDAFIDTIEFEKIVPCYAHLPQNVVALLPLLLALLLHHYHNSLDTLGDENPLRLSPLWNDENGILYRHHLFENLRGVGHGPDHINALELRDINSDQWTMVSAGFEIQLAMMKDMSKVLGDQSSKNTQDCVRKANFILSEITGKADTLEESALMPHFSSVVRASHAVHCAATPSASDISNTTSQPPNPRVDYFRILEQPPVPFKMPGTLSCKKAFYRMHCLGPDRGGLWREKEASDIDASVVGPERKTMRELFNKALTVCKMLLGSNKHAEIDRLGIDKAWTLCKFKVNNIWDSSLNFDILGADGAPAVRTVYNIMHGKDTFMSTDTCTRLREQCVATSIDTGRSQIQAALSFLPVISNSNTATNQSKATVDDTVLDIDDTQDHVPKIEDTVECFVCEVCKPHRLHREWADWTRCARGHLSSRDLRDKQHFFKDQVRTVRGQKSNPSVPTSRYIACGTPTFKHYSTEEKLVFFRQRIIYAGLLKKGDRIEIQLLNTGQSNKALVVSGQLALITKSWKVEVAILDSQNPLILDKDHPGTEWVWVNSILAVIPNSQTPTNIRANVSKLDPYLNDRQKTNLGTAASAAQTQYRGTVRGRGLEPVVLDHEYGMESGTPKRPQHMPCGTTGRPQAEWKQLCDSEYLLGIGAHIMLRDAAEFGKPFFIPMHKIHVKNSTGLGANSRDCIKFPIFAFKEAQFIESDLGITFGGIYPDSVQKVLKAFELDESNRCFFLSLGFATNIDPFMLQCLFRKHAQYLRHNKDAVLRCIGDGEGDEGLKASISSELDEAISITNTDSYVDCCSLRYFWPVEFDTLRVVIICKRGDRVFQSVYNASGTERIRIQSFDDGNSKKTIFLKLESGHYTVLTLLHGHIDVCSDNCCSWFLHDIDSQLRCPSVKSMQFHTHANNDSYVATAVEGNMPSEQDVDAMYLQVTGKHGIKFDSKGTWLAGLPDGISTENWNQQGSLVPESWNRVRNALMHNMNNFYEEQPQESRQRSHRGFMKSPKATEKKTVATTPVVFLDVGCESGRGLVRMLHDHRITHVAGIELQPAWFKLSVVLFQELRALFLQNGFRMPSVTIFNSCLMSPKPELLYIYSTCSIVVMNNEVFDKKPFFVSHRGANKLPSDVRNAPLSHMDGDAKKYLSPNAAFTLSKHFQNSTSIAVFKPEHFSDQLDYSIPTTLHVTCTWSTFEVARSTVSLMDHMQHVNIAPGVRLVCASPKYVRLWQEYMRKWSNSLPLAFLIMQNPKYDPRSKPRKKTGTELGQNVVIHSDESCDAPSDTSDLEDILPDIQELDTLSTDRHLNIQTLASLNPRQMLHEDVLFNYMILLEARFPLISFRPWMTGLCTELRETTKRLPEYIRKQCTKYIFQKQATDRGTFIFALNPGLHWIAFKIDFSKKYIASMCSLQDPQIDMAQAIKSWISSLCADARNFEHYSVAVPNQRNAVDCGPLCCMFLLFLSQNDISRSTKLEYDTISTASAMRLRIFADIAQKKITPLVTKNGQLYAEKK